MDIIKAEGDSFGMTPADVIKEFLRDYLILFREFKENYFGLAVRDYLRIAEYLKGVKEDKWVLNFYQIGNFPQMKTSGRIYQDIEYFANETGNEAIIIKSMLMDYTHQIEGADKWLIDNISNLFYNSGTSFHTMIMLPRQRGRGILEEYSYRKMTNESEGILRKLSAMTGGSIVRTNRLDKFMEQISNKEDIVYMLTYVPETGGGNRSRLKVRVKGDRYRVVFDNQFRPSYLRNLKKTLERENPDIIIREIHFRQGDLAVILDNITMTGEGNDRFGIVRVKVMIMDRQGKLLKELNKQFKGKRGSGLFTIHIPHLTAGSYEIVVEVRDLYSWKSTVTGKSLRIRG
jgi:hypothetical protein